MIDFGLGDVARGAQSVLTGNSLIRLAATFARQPASVLSKIAQTQGFEAAGRALISGRIDDLAAAAGRDVIAALAEAGTQKLNQALFRHGKLLEHLLAFDRSDPPPAGEVLMILGTFPFMLGTAAHQSLKRINDYRWAKQARLNRPVARQFVGVGDERLTLAGSLLPHYTGGADSMTRLRKLASAGEPLELIDHFGLSYGRFAIEKIEETASELDVYGQGRRLDFTLEIAAYGEDDDLPPVVAAAKAVASNAAALGG